MSYYYDQLQDKSRSPTEETPREAIRRVREKSCYGALRAVMACTVIPGYLLAAGGALATLGIIERPPEVSPLLLGIVTGLILVATLAIHQAMRLLVDIADLLIDMTRNK